MVKLGLPYISLPWSAVNINIILDCPTSKKPYFGV